MRIFKSRRFTLLLSVSLLSGEDQILRHETQTPRVLNNFVTEILPIQDLVDYQTHVFRIDNPRTGWLFFRMNG